MRQRGSARLGLPDLCRRNRRTGAGRSRAGSRDGLRSGVCGRGKKQSRHDPPFLCQSYGDRWTKQRDSVPVPNRPCRTTAAPGQHRWANSSAGAQRYARNMLDRFHPENLEHSRYAISLYTHEPPTRRVRYRCLNCPTSFYGRPDLLLI